MQYRNISMMPLFEIRSHRIFPLAFFLDAVNRFISQHNHENNLRFFTVPGLGQALFHYLSHLQAICGSRRYFPLNVFATLSLNFRPEILHSFFHKIWLK